MAAFTKVVALEQLTEGQPFCTEVSGQKLALFKIGDHVYATTNTCTHAGGPLCEGELNGSVVTCPWHGSRFDVTKGSVIHGPAIEPIKTYQARIIDNMIEVEI